MFGENRERWVKYISIFIGVVVIGSMVVSTFAYAL